jgi:hypothetical protein
MRVLVACEFSGVVRDAFLYAGHDAISCDLAPTESEGPHHTGDIIEFVESSSCFDLIIAHPPCTYLAVSGNRWYAGTQERDRAFVWTKRLWWLMRTKSIACALENPVGVLGSWWRKADQYIQPWMFGHPETKKTGLWLKNLPPLRPTHSKPEKIAERVWRMAPSPDRAKERSRFYPGIAKAMAEQWTQEASRRKGNVV